MEVIIGKQFPSRVVPLIDMCKHSLDVVVFDWRWYPQDPGASVQLFNQSIVRASLRGVKVRAIVNNDQIKSILTQNGIEAHRLKIRNLLHCKIMVLDGKIAVTGSHNYTQSAFQMNMELSVVVTDTFAVQQISQFVNNLWQS